MKRFYGAVATAEAAGGFEIRLDGKRLLTPNERSFILPSEALATAIAEEWAAQAGEIRPATMPLTKLASTAIDRVADRREAVIDDLVGHAGADLLCYRAAEPRDLVERQHRLWQPLLDWASLRFDAPLRVVAGIVPVAQPPASLQALCGAVGRLSILELTAVADLAATAGSLVLALALHETRIDAAAAVDAALLEETFQIERWGEDAEAAERRRQLAADIHAAARFLGTLRG